MPLPDTFPGLAIAGYRYESDGRCRACGATMEWFLTPKNRRMPFSYKAGSHHQLEPHHAVCPKREQFASKRKKR